MRRTLVPVALALAALAATGVAVAKLTATGTAAVSATFSATQLVRSSTQTCTGADGTYEITHARYAGTASSSEAALAGNLVVTAKSVYNTTEKLGWIEGTFRVRDDDPSRAHARFHAVNVNGALDGFVLGHTYRAWARLLGGFSAGWTRTGGFTDGKLGTGTATNTALLAARPCTPRRGTAVRLVVRGTVEAVTATSLAVKPFDGGATQTCAVGPRSPRVDGVQQGARVVMECKSVEGTLTLTSLRRA